MPCAEVVEVVPELEPDRLVQAELAAKRSNRRRRRVQAEQGPGRIAGYQPQEQEGDDDHAEHDGNREKDPAHDIAQPGPGEEPGRERCSRARASGVRPRGRSRGQPMGSLSPSSARPPSSARHPPTGTHHLCSRELRARSVAKRSGGLSPGGRDSSPLRAGPWQLFTNRVPQSQAVPRRRAAVFSSARTKRVQACGRMRSARRGPAPACAS